ncbi:MAG TPA: hypothetical protein VMH37_01510 [Candidatus Binataceae bacterium]|nr:hypothetical protein [Candidatus Binataceae bacterium]
MMTSNKRAFSGLAVALTFVAMATVARAQDQGAASTTISKVPPASDTTNPPASTGVGSHLAAVPAVAAMSPEDKAEAAKTLRDPNLRQKVKDVLTKLTPERARLNKEYQQAAALFPAFCKDWERKLHDREANNINHLMWKVENGFDTALYTGYGPVKTCETHQSDQGFSIGKLSYEEFHYLMKGKTEDEAKHTPAATVDDTHTTEIFRWDKGKWFY